MLTEQQIKNFKRDGFILIKGLYNVDEIKNITSWTEEVSNYPETPGKYMMYFIMLMQRIG